MLDSVVIVGGGPCGLALACALGVRGTPFTLVERRGPAAETETAVELLYPDARRILEAWDVAVPGRDLAGGLRAVTLAAAEAALLARARGLSCGTIRHEAEMVAIQQDAEGVTLDVRRGTRMEVDRVRGAWLAACDGRHSLARRRLKLRVEEAPAERTFVTADVRTAGPPAAAVEVSPGAARIPGPDGLERWVLELGPDEDGQDLARPAALAERVGRRGDPPEVLAFRYFTMHDRLCPHWQEGRAFLAGDAAHVLNPLWNRGLSLAVADAAALARHFQDGDRYSRERHPAVRAEIEAETPPLGLELSHPV